MTLGLTSTGAVKIKSDGGLGLRAVNCACCGVCPPIDAAYVLITKGQYDALLAGGTLSGSVYLNEPGYGGSCSWTKSIEGTMESGQCNGFIGAYEDHCVSDRNTQQAHLELLYSIAKSGAEPNTEYRLSYVGHGACPEAYDLSNGIDNETVCYSVGYYISSSCDAGDCAESSFFYPVGDFNIVTSAGTITAKVLSFPNLGTGGATVTITPVTTTP